MVSSQAEVVASSAADQADVVVAVAVDFAASAGRLLVGVLDDAAPAITIAALRVVLCGCVLPRRLAAIPGLSARPLPPLPPAAFHLSRCPPQVFYTFRLLLPIEPTYF